MWLSEHLDIVAIKCQYIEAKSWRHMLEERLQNTSDKCGIMKEMRDAIITWCATQTTATRCYGLY